MKSGSKPRRKAALVLKWHKASRQYCKYVGQHVARDGRLKPTLWYLGRDSDADPPAGSARCSDASPAGS